PSCPRRTGARDRTSRRSKCTVDAGGRCVDAKARRPRRCRQQEVSAEQRKVGSPLTDSNRRPLLTIATHGNGFSLFVPVSRRRDLRAVATGCNHGLHKGSIPCKPFRQYASAAGASAALLWERRRPTGA